MLTRTIRAAMLCGAVLLGASPIAAAGPFDSGSAGQPAPRPTVTLGAYCESTTSTPAARTTDGHDAYCVQVAHTDAHVWWPAPGTIPADPNTPVRAGDSCLDEGARWFNPDGQRIVCEKTQNGRLRGDLVWMLDR
ncbi:hypothetical protein [Nocardia sp. N2S4-5]|uniref:hypothetical protein n=1 Tax=Nocardia sp. N2S4-5 TaxID=3351565 RepID=UPI0037D4A969